MIYKTLVLLLSFSYNSEKYLYFSLVATLIYAVHPLHTEVVANIKGRDEIVSMLASIGALFFMLKGWDKQKTSYFFIAAVLIFFGLLSKENTITFLAVIPLALYFFRNVSLANAILTSTWVWPSVILFLIIRTSVLGFDTGGTPMELMNNPFIKLVGENYVPFSGTEKLATIISVSYTHLTLPTSDLV